MASVSSQPQFRYTHTPSKVVHLRNLPWECTEEELIELGKPFGKVVNTKCNVGAYRNQAFIEFTNPMVPVVSSAIDATGQFSLGLDGKKIESESNVLLASIENMQYAGSPWMSYTWYNLKVFSAFGPVLKIAMFDKNRGVQALIQYPDVETAVMDKEVLNLSYYMMEGFASFTSLILDTLT